MKRTWRAILALTLVCAVALTAAARALGSKALPLTMTDACTIGDPAAAEGLHMAARIGMEQNRLQWRMDYDPAADTTDASFRLAYSDRSGQWVFDGSGYNIQCLLVDQEDDSDPICREVLRQARASGEELVDVTVHLADYWQDLPLSLSGASWPGGGDFVDVYGPWDIGDTVPFPALSIPVRESDDLTVTLARNADGSYEINGYDFTGISYAMYFTPFSLPLEGGTLTTLGIDPAAQPQPDWAPEGYGLWYVPVQTGDDGSSTPVPSRRQLVYPLDITRQQVVTLKQEKLGGTVCLMTQEDGQLVLRLLEGGTYRLLQELPLGPVPESDPGTGGYHTLTIRDGFIVVLWDDQLTVLSRTEEGYHLDYTCPTQTAYVTGYTVSFTDPELESRAMRMPCRIPWRPTSPWPIRTGSWRWPPTSATACLMSCCWRSTARRGCCTPPPESPAWSGSLPPTMSVPCGCGRTRRPPSRRRISPPPSRSLLGRNDEASPDPLYRNLKIAILRAKCWTPCLRRDTMQKNTLKCEGFPAGTVYYPVKERFLRRGRGWVIPMGR